MLEPSTGDDLSRRLFVGAASIASAIAALGIFVTTIGGLAIAAIVALSFIAFITAVWAIFWVEINNHFPKLKTAVAAIGPKLMAMSVPLLILTIAIGSADALYRFNSYKLAKSALAISNADYEKKRARLQGEADYWRIVIQGKDGKGGLRADLGRLEANINGPTGYLGTITNLRTTIDSMKKAPPKIAASAPQVPQEDCMIKSTTTEAVTDVKIENNVGGPGSFPCVVSTQARSITGGSISYNTSAPGAGPYRLSGNETLGEAIELRREQQILENLMPIVRKAQQDASAPGATPFNIVDFINSRLEGIHESFRVRPVMGVQAYIPTPAKQGK